MTGFCLASRRIFGNVEHSPSKIINPHSCVCMKFMTCQRKKKKTAVYKPASFAVIVGQNALRVTYSWPTSTLEEATHLGSKMKAEIPERTPYPQTFTSHIETILTSPASQDLFPVNDTIEYVDIAILQSVKK